MLDIGSHFSVPSEDEEEQLYDYEEYMAQFGIVDENAMPKQ